ncbi:TPA: glycosyltransferase [Photobacterium damselae]
MNLEESEHYGISVLMSIYYKEKSDNLDCCLKSLFEQTLKAKEIIMVHDGPLTKELYDCLHFWKKKLPITEVILEKNVGLGRALNIGLDKCNYELVARMDTDDICVENRFSLQLNEFLDDPDLVICGSSIAEFEGNVSNIISRRRVPENNQDILLKSIEINPFNHMTVMYKKSFVVSCGGYLHLPWMEDWYLWLRMLSSGCKGKNINSDLVFARTGMDMIIRRSGLDYIKSEWLLTKIKVNLGLASRRRAFIIFIKRAAPRVLPKKWLSKFYLISRKIHA